MVNKRFLLISNKLRENSLNLSPTVATASSIVTKVARGVNAPLS
jgi:hypothetical protein